VSRGQVMRPELIIEVSNGDNCDDSVDTDAKAADPAEDKCEWIPYEFRCSERVPAPACPSSSRANTHDDISCLFMHACVCILSPRPLAGTCTRAAYYVAMHVADTSPGTWHGRLRGWCRISRVLTGRCALNVSKPTSTCSLFPV
jgi:hypothetical protein